MHKSPISLPVPPSPSLPCALSPLPDGLWKSGRKGGLPSFSTAWGLLAGGLELHLLEGGDVRLGLRLKLVGNRDLGLTPVV